MPRKPLDEACNGSIDCPVDGHVKIWPISYQNQRVQITHTPLTYGQLLTLRDRRTARSAMTNVPADVKRPGSGTALASYGPKEES